MFADGRSYPIKGGVKNRMYEHYPWLYLQIDREAEFVAAPDWYYNFEYLEEKERGYPYREDLLTTGYFEMDVKRGDSVIFSCSLKEEKPEKIAEMFEEELSKRSKKVDFLSCLRHSARQFIVRRRGKTEVVAGYPWFGRWGRDTFIALPGITLSQGDERSFREVMDTMTSEMKDGMFPNMGQAYNSVDAPLWFFWALQQYGKEVGSKEVWESYGGYMKDVLNSYRGGGSDYVKVDENGLVWASNPNLAMTWMDAVVDGKPVTGRDGYQVEINALWYNAICYTLELAREFRDTRFIGEWKEMPELVKESFIEKFWIPEESYLADYVNDEEQNRFIRPNQIIACSLDHRMLSEEQMLGVVRKVRRHLLTPKGLRTLSPNNPLYEGHYGGSQPKRDRQYHQGTVWPWLLEHYVAANFTLHGESYVKDAEKIVHNFDDDLSVHGIGSIAEIYDGDPPHEPNGTPSQAWSVASLLRIIEMIELNGGHRRARANKLSMSRRKKRD